MDMINGFLEAVMLVSPNAQVKLMEVFGREDK
jgi:hypothetical protein